MNEYDQKIYDFFATADNFRNMYKIASHFDFVKKRLLEEFWLRVKYYLDELNNKEGHKWEVQLTGNVDVESSKMLLFKKHWPHAKGLPIVAIAYSRMGVRNWPFYGLFVNREISGFNQDRMCKYAESLPAAIGFDNDRNNDWPFWKDIGIDFAKDEDFTRIVPSEREGIANDFAAALFHLATEMESELEIMSAMKSPKDKGK